MILSLSSCRSFSSNQWLRPSPFDKSEPHCDWIHSVTDGLISKPTTELGATSSSSWLELWKNSHNQTKMAEENDWKSFSGTHSELKGLPKLHLWTPEKWSGEDSKKRHFGKVARIWRETGANCLNYIICGHSIIKTSKNWISCIDIPTFTVFTTIVLDLNTIKDVQLMMSNFWVELFRGIAFLVQCTYTVINYTCWEIHFICTCYNPL